MTFLSKTKSLVPITPVATSEATTVMPPSDLNDLLDEQMRSLQEKFNDLSRTFPDDSLVLTRYGAFALVIFNNIKNICEACKRFSRPNLSKHYYNGVDYVEDMIRQQLIAAIGREVTSADFTEYMNFHNRKLFKPDYKLTPFSYPVRFEDKAPEGRLQSIP